MITHVAIKDKNGKIWALPKPNRHGHVIRFITTEVANTEEPRGLIGYGIQGFVNDKGEFLDRNQAFLDAVACNQILPPYNPINQKDRRGTPDHTPRELFSEDLW